MTDALKVTKRIISKKPIDIFVSGYLLDEEMLTHLCILKYGATEASLKKYGSVDIATCYYEDRDVLDAPWLVPIRHKGKLWWLLPGKAAFFVSGTKPPDLPLDRETREYLNVWLPLELLKRPEFKGARYAQTHWPRDLPGTSLVLQV